LTAPNKQDITRVSAIRLKPLFLF